MRFDIVNARFDQLDRTPWKPAVVGSDGSITWAEFKVEVERMADVIRGLELPAGHPVMVRGHKEVGMVSAMAACMLCGHPYIPLDVVVPMDRVKRIQVITGSQLLIDHTADAIPETIRNVWQNGSLRQNAHAPVGAGIPDRPQDPIRYSIYTSGSTG